MRPFLRQSWESSLPEGVDPGVLTEALHAALDLFDLDGPETLRWLVGPRIERRNSVLFPLRLVSAVGHCLDAYYKTYRHNGSEIQSRLIRMRELHEAFAAASYGEAIAVPRVLALRPRTLTMVSSAIRGRPLESALGYSVTPHRRRVALEACRRIGRAAYLIEQLPLPDEPVLDLAPQDRIDRSLERAHEFLEPDAWHSLRGRIFEARERVLEGGLAVYAHGDLSGTNVLFGSNSVGFVDFGWQVRWPGYDLARLACRIALDPAVRSLQASALTAALTDGYGDLGLTSSPGWEFYTLRTTLRYAVKERRRSAGRSLSARRARRQLLAQT